MIVECDRCRRRQNVPNLYSGKIIHCPACGAAGPAHAAPGAGLSWVQIVRRISAGAALAGFCLGILMTTLTRETPWLHRPHWAWWPLVLSVIPLTVLLLTCVEWVPRQRDNR